MMRDEAPPVRPDSADSQLTAPVAPDHPPTRPGVAIGGYRIVRKLGHGGMGVVWEAEQQQPRRPVALKVIRSGRLVDEHQVKLVQREAQTLVRLEHPGIAAIYEAGCTAGGEHFFAMELVRGETLAEYMATRRDDSERPLEVGEILSLFLQITDAVGYAHQRAVIHRDLKPSNILVTGERSSRDGPGTESQQIKVVDFSLARIAVADVAADTMLSESGSIWGTLEYMSPEQTRGNPDEIDLRSDVYSLGVILYELLTGALPYQLPVTGVVEAIRIIREERPRSPAKTWMENRGTLNTTDRRLDADLATIVLKALEKEPSRRYQSASDLAGDVELYLSGQPIMARPPSTACRLRKLVARHSLGFEFLVLLLVLFSVGHAHGSDHSQEGGPATTCRGFRLHLDETPVFVIEFPWANNEAAGESSRVVEPRIVPLADLVDDAALHTTYSHPEPDAPERPRPTWTWPEYREVSWAWRFLCLADPDAESPLCWENDVRRMIERDAYRMGIGMPKRWFDRATSW